MLSVNDLLMAPLAFIVLRMVFLIYLRKYKDPAMRRLLNRTFYFKMLMAVLFALISALYYGSGDTEMFLYAAKDMRDAISAGDLTFWELARYEKMEPDSPLAYYFEQDWEKYPVSGFMRSPSNFLVPKLAVIPSYLFMHSFIALCMVFSFFALGGMIRLYKTFIYFFPKMPNEIALATLFLPSACYWSSGLLKDSITFGSMGFLLYGLLNIFIKHKRIAASVFWVVISSYFIYTIKAYVLLALIPGVGFWLFGQLGAVTRNLAIRRTITVVSIVFAAIGGIMLLNYMTSSDNLAKFSLDNLLESSSRSRLLYEREGIKNTGAYFEINTSSPGLMVVNGLVATLFRPFPWEVSSAIVLLSAVESMMFLALIVFLVFKKGITAPFRKILDNPILILCFSFSIIFAVSIGISSSNFGSLSRYKIPCLPFYLIFVLAAYRLLGQQYPRWFRKILSIVKVK